MSQYLFYKLSYHIWVSLDIYILYDDLGVSRSKKKIHFTTRGIIQRRAKMKNESQEESCNQFTKNKTVFDILRQGRESRE